MQYRVATRLLSASIIVAGLAAAPAAFADNVLSAQQIKDALLPGGTATGSLSRGIKPAGSTTAPAAAPAGTATVTSTPAAGADKPAMIDLSINFASGSDELTPQAMAALNELGKALTSPELASLRFRIEGHTDTTGTKAENQALSDRRAAAVVQYLSKNFAVDPMRLDAVGKGESDLLVPTPDQTPEPRNRRVRVVNLGG